MIIEKPYKAVIVDDSASVRAFLSSIIAQNPAFQAVAFEDAEEALVYIEKEKARFVLVDINMPSMFGDDVLRRCVAMKQGIQVYVITGTDSLTIADRCMNVGARGIIPKPLLADGCKQAMADAEAFFGQWNRTMHYFLGKRKAG